MKKLPKDFCVKANKEHELWDEYIQWLNEKGESYNGLSSSAYGIRNGKPDCNDQWGEAEVITLEQWHEAVNAKSEFPEPVFITKSGVEIYDEVEMLVWDNDEAFGQKSKVLLKSENLYVAVRSDGVILRWKNAKPIPEEVEVTMEEIAKWKGVDVKQIKIK